MEIGEKVNPIDAAKQFIIKYYPNCQGAVLAGSVVRGEGTETSDLDIVVFDQNITNSYRESVIEFGWPIEIFVHSLTSYKWFFQLDYKTAKPSMQRMIDEGMIIKDTGVLNSIKQEAKEMLEKGPERWPAEVIKTKRYFLTDVLEDFIGAKNRGEELFVANTLSILLHEFFLRTNGQWIGTSKWIVRALKQYDELFAEEFIEVFDNYYKTGNKGKIIMLTDKVLAPFGGRLFDGFSIGKENI